MDLQPLFSRIIIKRKDMSKTTGGIYIPENTQGMKATEGEVVAVGSEVTDIKVGDVVFWGKYQGATIERERQEYVMMNEEDVIAKIFKNNEQ